MHRIRAAMSFDSPAPLKGIVEVDEKYVGGKPRKGQWKPGREVGRGTPKTPVLAVVHHDGEVRTEVIERVDAKTLKAAICEHVAKESAIMTDEWAAYRGIGNEFTGGQFTVTHSLGEYPRGNVNSKTVESYLAFPKRGVYGAFHSISRKHLHHYCGEFSFRWNTREMNDCECLDAGVNWADGKRLTYKQQIKRGNAA